MTRLLHHCGVENDRSDCGTADLCLAGKMYGVSITGDFGPH
jgi:hypothetical protein